MQAPLEKVWGTTECLMATPMFELHRLHIKPFVRCSLHIHRFKWNLFYIMDGRLLVDMVEGDFNRARCSEARAGETINVPPAVDHQFRTESEGCIALEMYYLEPLAGIGSDIIRRNEGGPVERT